MATIYHYKNTIWFNIYKYVTVNIALKPYGLNDQTVLKTTYSGLNSSNIKLK